MARAPKPDILAELDHLLAAGGTDVPPWRKPDEASDEHEREYVPDYAMLRNLLAMPIEQGHARSQQSGRVAKSLDAYIAYELRRAGFDAASVFPRAQQPRVLPPELAEVEQAVERLLQLLADYEALGNRLRLRRPDGPFDGTVLLVADWDGDSASPKLNRVEDPSPTLALPRFFEDLLDAAMSYTPVDIHERVRALKHG